VRILALTLVGLVSLEAQAAQIVALDLAAGGGVTPALARAMSSVLLNELSRREGMSVISQADVRALLELEANKQMLGCDDTKCMTEIAGSLGAELMISSELARAGETFVVSLALISVAEARVVRRAEGRSRGTDEVATEAIAAALHDLFRAGLPAELQGPRALSRRGFKAALAGLFQATLTRGGDVKSARRRVILDLVHTELDYDASPKIDTLDLDIRRSIARLRDLALLSADSDELEHLLSAIDHYHALADDLGRVREIRERSRARGVVPSDRPLRFESPEPRERTDPEARERYAKLSEPARKVVRAALEAYRKGDAARFVRLWPADRAEGAKRELADNKASDERYGYTYDLLPIHATPPWLFENAISTLERKEMLVFLRRYKAGEIDDEVYVRLAESDGGWQITSW